MFGKLAQRLGSLRYASPATLWTDLRFWWYTTHNRGPLLLLSGVFTSLGLAAALIAHAMEQTHIERQLHCLALNVYHEARGEPTKGQFAVAEVTLNRVESKRFPDSICSVVFEKRWDRIRKRDVGAFSWTELDRAHSKKPKEWQKARVIAEQVYYGAHNSLVDGALFYHAKRIRPSWARKKQRTARIGRHIFYR